MVSFDSLFFTTCSYALAGFCRRSWRCRQDGFWDLQRDLCSIFTEFLLLLSNLFQSELDYKGIWNPFCSFIFMKYLKNISQFSQKR